MKKKVILALLTLGIIPMLSGCNVLVLNPKGPVAATQAIDSCDGTDFTRCLCIVCLDVI